MHIFAKINKPQLKLLFLLNILVLLGTDIYGQCNPGGDDGGPQGGGGGAGIPFSIIFIASRDPNDIQGPKGVFANQWKAAKDVFGYTVRFENDPAFANGPAQKVTVKIPIHPNFDINTLRLGNFGFGNLIFTVPPNSPTYNTRLDLRDSLGLYVDVLAGINVADHEAIWIFQSIDPLTGAEPLNAQAGFLPVRDTTIKDFGDSIPNKGEGFVSFSIIPKTTVHTGDTVTAQAGIIFDINAPVMTNIWKNKIDAVAPTSYVHILPTFVDPEFPLQWTGTDDPGGVGLKSYDIYVSRDSGAYQLLSSKTTSTGIQFTGGISGATYSFYSLAIDHTGNREAPKSTGDAKSFIYVPNIVICPGENISFAFDQLPAGSYSYQWQVDSGNGFVNLNNSILYNGTNASLLTLTTPPTSHYGHQFRCIATGTAGTLTSGTYVLRFSMTWNGSASVAWENPANWSCNLVPDGFVDVVVNSGVSRFPTVNSAAICRSLSLGNGVIFTVIAGQSLNIKGKR